MIGHPHDDIEALALGELEPSRAREVLAHADKCPTCAVLLADAMNGIAALAQVESPMDVKRAVPVVPARVVKLPIPESRLRSAAGWFASAAAAAILALLAWNIQLRNDAISVPIDTLVHSHFIHHPLTNPKTAAAAKVLQALDGRWLYVVADGLTPHERYDVWETRSGHESLIGEFATDGSGRGAKYFEQPAGPIDAFAITETGRSPEQDEHSLRWQ